MNFAFVNVIDSTGPKPFELMSAFMRLSWKLTLACSRLLRLTVPRPVSETGFLTALDPELL